MTARRSHPARVDVCAYGGRGWFIAARLICTMRSDLIFNLSRCMGALVVCIRVEFLIRASVIAR